MFGLGSQGIDGATRLACDKVLVQWSARAGLLLSDISAGPGFRVADGATRFAFEMATMVCWTALLCLDCNAIDYEPTVVRSAPWQAEHRSVRFVLAVYGISKHS